MSRQIAAQTHQQKPTAKPTTGGLLWRKAIDRDEAFVTSPIVNEVLRSPGQPLDPVARSFFEPRFDHDFSLIPVKSNTAPSGGFAIVPENHPLEHSADAAARQVLGKARPIAVSSGANFSQVKIHTGPLASEAARIVRARAFTVASNIVFGANEYRPYTHSGQRLLAHELAHVVQQRRGYSATKPEAYHAEGMSQRRLVNVIQREAAPAADPLRSSLNYVLTLDYDRIAEELHRAMAGPGTDEEGVYFSLNRLRHDLRAIRLLRDTYKKKYKVELIDEIRDEFSGNELEYALQLLNAGKDFEADTPEQLARKIREAFRGWGTDEVEVYRILSYPPDQVRAMINYYNDKLNDHTGKGLVEDIKDEFSDSELAEAMRLLANAKIVEHTVERTTQIQSSVPGEPNKVWAGLIVRGMWSKGHEPGVMEQHADVVIPDVSGKMRTRGYFGDQPSAAGSSAGFRASTGMGIPGISADMQWFLRERPSYIDLELAKLVDMKSSLILIKVTLAQAVDLNKYWEDLKVDPGTFYILGKNCSTAAAAGFEHAYLSKEIVGLDTPDNLFQQLRKRYSDAFMISGYYGYTRVGRRWEIAGGQPRLRDAGTGSWNGPFVVEKRLV